MSRYFIHMAYDGAAYHGWQVQPNAPTVQAVMEEALSTLLRQNINVTGAGRTDTGVHASCFVAHFDHTIPGKDSTTAEGSTTAKMPDRADFLFKLNRYLPKDIVVYNIQKVDEELHARFSATYRSYQYHLAKIKPLFNRAYAHYQYGNLDMEAMEKCCKIILDTTDFTSFSKLHTDVKTNNCKVTTARWLQTEKGYCFEITADRFLRNMVRSLVGTLLESGAGRLDSKGFQDIVDAKDRSRAGQSAPAQGLFLVDIGYEGYSFKICR